MNKRIQTVILHSKKLFFIVEGHGKLFEGHRFYDRANVYLIKFFVTGRFLSLGTTDSMPLYF